MYNFENLIQSQVLEQTKKNMTITKGKGLVLIVCNNSKVPTFTKDFQIVEELGIYKNRSLRSF